MKLRILAVLIAYCAQAQAQVINSVTYVKKESAENITSAARCIDGTVLTCGLFGNSKLVVSRHKQNGTEVYSVTVDNYREATVTAGPDGSCYVTGVYDSSFVAMVAVTKLTPSGSVDGTFGTVKLRQIRRQDGYTDVHGFTSLTVDGRLIVSISEVKTGTQVSPGASYIRVLDAKTGSQLAFSDIGNVVVLASTPSNDGAYISGCAYDDGYNKACVLKVDRNGAIDNSFGLVISEIGTGTNNSKGANSTANSVDYDGNRLVIAGCVYYGKKSGGYDSSYVTFVSGINPTTGTITATNIFYTPIGLQNSMNQTAKPGLCVAGDYLAMCTKPAGAGTIIYMGTDLVVDWQYNTTWQTGAVSVSKDGTALLFGADNNDARVMVELTTGLSKCTGTHSVDTVSYDTTVYPGGWRTFVGDFQRSAQVKTTVTAYAVRGYCTDTMVYVAEQKTNGLDYHVARRTIAYPNPCTETLYSAAPGKLYDLNGRSVKIIESGQNSMTDLAIGTYLLVSDGSRTVIIKK